MDTVSKSALKVKMLDTSDEMRKQVRSSW